MSYKNFRVNFINAKKIFIANSIWPKNNKKYSDEKVISFWLLVTG